MGSNSIRTFIALDIGPDIRKTVHDIESRLKTLDCNVKWVDPDRVHMTLKFLGDVKMRKIDEIAEALENALREITPFEMTLDNLGGFPGIDHPKVIWIGIKEGKAQTEKIAERIEQALGMIGIKKSPKQFAAHLTIGRVRSPRNIVQLSRALQEIGLPDGLAQTISTVTLYKSTLTPSGPIYEPLNIFPLE